MEKCLVIQTAFLGDVILATPVPEAIKADHPDSRVDMLVRKGNEALLANNPNLTKTLVWHKQGAKYQDWWRLLRTIRREGYDTVINIQRFGATGLLTALSGAKARIGFKQTPFSRFFTARLPHVMANTSTSPHEVDRNLSLLSKNPKQGRIRPKLYPGPSAYEAVKSYQATPYLCIAPASVWFTKQFPQEQWITFLKQEALQQYPIYLLGGPEDYAFCDTIRKSANHGHITNLAGKLTFLETAALMTNARMNYTNDSAPLHMASAMNAPVTAVFCSTSPAFGFGPLSDVSHVVEVDDLYCRPCSTHGRKACPEGHFRCAYDMDIAKMARVIEG